MTFSMQIIAGCRGLRSYGIRVRGLRPRLYVGAAFAAKRDGQMCPSYDYIPALMLHQFDPYCPRTPWYSCGNS